MLRMVILFLFLSGCISSQSNLNQEERKVAQVEQGPSGFMEQEFPLDIPGDELHHPQVDDLEKIVLVGDSTSSKSDFMAALKYITPVKAQGSRNTCTVFSFTALLEAVFLKNNPQFKNVDFSEQWLQYLVAIRSSVGGVQGSTVPINYNQIQKYGFADEQDLSYSPTLWKEGVAPATTVCKGFQGLTMARCLMSQMPPSLIDVSDEQLMDKKNPLYNPNFVSARKSALDTRKSVTPYLSGKIVSSTKQIKERLRRGLPLTLEVNVYYGSWNHSGGHSLGIETDASLFAKGVITYPDKKSVDRVKSPEMPARHSVLIVGYDDDVIVKYKRKLVDGSVIDVERKGVYYFKNSWDKKKFGSKFKYEGKTIPGFGMITQDYANEMGQFFALDYSGKSI